MLTSSEGCQPICRKWSRRICGVACWCLQMFGSSRLLRGLSVFFSSILKKNIVILCQKNFCEISFNNILSFLATIGRVLAAMRPVMNVFVGVFVLLFHTVSSFSPSRPVHGGRLPSTRLSGHKNDDDERYKEALKRTDVRIFMTQRAMQSFIFLLIETRNPHTVRWLEVR